MQLFVLPVAVAIMHALVLVQEFTICRQLAWESHVSPRSTIPFPHDGRQSASVVELHPDGQHPSDTMLHAVIAAFAGQTADEPWHVAGCLQSAPLPARHSVPCGLKTSDGQTAEAPVQFSGISQVEPSAAVAAALQTVVGGANELTGQLLDAPSQASAVSQVPAGERHSLPAALFASAGQDGDVPSHVSCVSHTPAAGRHSLPAGLMLHELLLRAGSQTWQAAAGLISPDA